MPPNISREQQQRLRDDGRLPVTSETVLAAQAGLVPDGPPAEVLEAIASAAGLAAELAARGQHVHFAQDADTGQMRAAVHDERGNLVRALTNAEALNLAWPDPDGTRF